MVKPSAAARTLAAAAIILLAPALRLAAQGAPPGRPPKPAASLEAALNYAAPDGLLSRRSELKAEAALGKTAGLEVRAAASGTHIRSLADGYFPGELYKTAFSLTAEDARNRAAVTLQSNSDRPLHSPSETDLGFMFTRTFSESGPHAWYYGLMYSTRRSFARTVPLPFVGYRYATRDFTLVFPFLARWQVSRTVSLTANYQPVKYFRLSAAWRPVPFAGLALEAGKSLEQFLQAGRPHKGEALFSETNFLSLRPELSVSRRLKFVADLGWQWRGRYYTGKAYDDYHSRIRTGAGGAAGLSAQYKW